MSVTAAVLACQSCARKVPAIMLPWEREKGIALLYIVKAAAAVAHGTVVKAAAAAAARVLSFLQQH